MPTAVQIRRAALNRFVSDRLLAWCRDDWLDASLDDVLIQTAVLVEQSKARLDPMNQSLPLLVREALVVDPLHPIDQSDVACLGQERAVIDEAPQREQLVQAPRILVVTKNACDAHHSDTSMSMGLCLPGSYRRRTLEEASRMRSSSGSRRVAQRAPP